MIPNWRLVLKRAWTVRLLILAGCLSGLEVGFAVFADNPPISRATFASLYAIITIGALFARFYAQDNCHED